jgi:hypothetical protein
MPGSSVQIDHEQVLGEGASTVRKNMERDFEDKHGFAAKAEGEDILGRRDPLAKTQKNHAWGWRLSPD